MIDFKKPIISPFAIDMSSTKKFISTMGMFSVTYVSTLCIIGTRYKLGYLLDNVILGLTL